MESDIAISIKSLKKSYSNGVKALKKVDLEIKKGEIFGLLGANGAGKSTLINVLTTLSNKSKGKIEIMGIDFEANPSEAKTHLGVVPQEFNFNIFEKVQDIVIQQAGFYGIERKVAKERSEKYLKRLGLWDKKDSMAMQLSGGMKRRLMIVRSLIHEPDILILDEPSAGVDVELRREMWDFIREIHKAGKTIILTTHYLEEAEMLCDRIGIIAEGKILEVGTVKELLSELKKEIIILDVQAKNFDKLPKRYRVIDQDSIETDFMKNEDLFDITQELHKVGIKIIGIKNRSNRLEEVFINKIVKS